MNHDDVDIILAILIDPSKEQDCLNYANSSNDNDKDNDNDKVFVGTFN